MKRVTVTWYAVLRDRRGLAEESVLTAAADLGALYEELRARHGLGLERSRLRAALDDDFADWTTPLADGARVVFIPPVAGG